VIHANTVNAVSGAATLSVPINVGSTVVQGGNVQQPFLGTAAHTIYSVAEVPASAENTVTLRITTDTASRYVWIYVGGADPYRLANLVQSDTRNIWEVSYRPNVFAPHTVQVNAFSAYLADPSRAIQNVPVNLTAPFIRAASPSITQALRASPNTIDHDGRSTITVRTNPDVEYVWATVDGTRVDATRGASTVNQRTWTIETPRMTRSETIRVYANTTNTATGADTSTIRVTVRERWETDAIGAVAIRSAWLSPNHLASWQNLTVDVTTNRETENVWIVLPNGQRRNFTLTYSSASGDRNWRMSFIPSSYGMQIGGQNIRVYANRGSGTNSMDSRTLWVDITH
jgi:hypothetical protein